MVSGARRVVLYVALVLVAAVLAGAAGWVSATRAPTVYESDTRLLVGPMSADIDSLRASDLLTTTYAELVTSQAVLRSVIERLGLRTTPGELAAEVDAVGDGGTRLLTITVRDGDPEDAERVADALAVQLQALTASLDDGTDARLRVVDAPLLGSRVPSQSGLTAMLAGLGGALFAVAALVLFPSAVARISVSPGDRRRDPPAQEVTTPPRPAPEHVHVRKPVGAGTSRTRSGP